MRTECRFAKAGQGLFYNGLIVDQKGRSFSFAYDCGSTDAAAVLRKSIIEFREFAGGRLDLLSISHFHRDHVSHIPELINGLELGTVVIPFVRPELRLLLAAQHEEIENDSEYISFYSDPAKYFIAKGAMNVVVATDSENRNENLDFFDNIGNDFPQSDGEGNEPPNYTVIFGKRDTQSTSLFESGIANYSGNFSVIAPSFQWEFRFKNLHFSKMRDNFLDDISKLLEEHNNRFDEILKNKTYTKQLRKIYEDNFDGRLNDTSLIMLSRPLQRGVLVDDFSCGRFDVNTCADYNDECYDRWLKYGRASTLLLGDLSLDHKTIYPLVKHPPQLLPRVIQLPHHGARIEDASSCHKLFHVLMCRRCLPISFVASYGIRNGYGHPDLSYYTNCRLYDSFWQNTHIELVNERKEFSYTIAF